MAANAPVFRFGPCALDEARRALLAHGREIRLQPRVFDLLCYLVRHRDRVVPKSELLDALWPGAVVVDNAVQRVVSLARAALAEAGVDNALRTYARHGYRFCFDEDGAVAEDAAADLSGPRAAALGGDWAGACAAYAAASARSPLPPDDVDQWGRAAICAGLGASVVDVLEQAVAERDGRGDMLGAARAALLLVQIRTDQMQGPLARGLLQRAARFVAGHPGSAEAGHVAWMASRLALGSGAADDALARADEACDVGRRLRDADVECLGLVYRGHALIARGAAAEGVREHEEAAALVQLGAVRSWVAGWALCSVLYAARHRCDWLRAAAFAEAFEAWSRASRMPAFPGTCQLHRAAVRGVQGALAPAAAELSAAAAQLAEVAPWAEGDAYRVLGEVQLDLGEFERAEASFRRAHALGWDPQPGLARLQLATGRAAAALRGLEQALETTDWTLRERRGQLLCLLVIAAVFAGAPDRARAALAQLDAAPELRDTEALQAMHLTSAAAVACVDGEPGRAATLMHQAVHRWRTLGSPVYEADARLALASCLLDAGNAEGAELEIEAAGALLPGGGAHRARIAALRERLAAA